MFDCSGMAVSSIRLTSLAHGGGCGCKLAPSVLQQILADQPAASLPRPAGRDRDQRRRGGLAAERQGLRGDHRLLHAGGGRPRDFGRIAAANALSDVYAMGGTPILALAIVGMPVGKLPVETIGAILEGGAAVCAEAGVPVAGGHSIDSVEPIYGLAVIGLCSPENVRRNSGARPGDALILTKAIGIGIYSAAFKKLALPDEAYSEMIASTTLLNRIGYVLAQDDDVHGVTDVTGFGLLGHGLELARGAGVGLSIEQTRIPFLARAEALAEAGYLTGASGRNWESYGSQVLLPPALPSWRCALLTDPQTSGGLLVACKSERAESIRAMIEAAGYPRASIIGSVAGCEPTVRIV